MKRKKLKIIASIALSLSLNSFLLHSQQLAFPGAEGFGRYASGGRGGTVYHVTNLDDSGPGSFRDAVSQPNRTVVFDTAGVINLVERVVIQKNITIAGQTAPGGGITLYGNGIALTSSSGNNIIRYIRVRMGVGGDYGKDAVGISEGQDYMLDHVSVSWGRDGTIDINGDIGNVTIQNSIISQGLVPHSTGGLMQSSGGVSLLRNLWIDNHTRNPKVKGINEFVNNVVYNWNVAAYILGDSEGDSYANVINNYFVSGPNTSSAPFTRGNLNFHLYAHNNIKDLNNDGVLDAEILAENEYDTVDWCTEPHDFPVLNSLEPSYAMSLIAEQVGSNYPIRDGVDSQLIKELLSYGTLGELIENENTPPMNGAGIISGGTAPLDTDQDGMPDDWETAHGLNKNDPEDRNAIGYEHYTMLEIYLNSIGHNEHKATLEVLGEGKPTQTVDKDSLITEFQIAWDYAHTVCVNGLPTGVSATVDDDKKLVSFSGAPQVAGIFYYTITTFGGSPDAALLDTLIVAGGDSAIITLNGPGDSIQTVEFGDTITDLNYSWEKATTVEITGLPPGLVTSVNDENKTILISGIPSQPGIFNYSISTSGGEIDVVSTGKITVASENSTIIIQENQAGFCEIDGTIDSDNSGFTGDGYANTANEKGAAIEYQVISNGGQSYLVVAYANGSSDRPASVTINNEIVIENLSLPNTSGWSTWKTVMFRADLQEGKNKIRFAATAGGGLPNIDYLSVTSPEVEPGDCIDPVPDTFQLSTHVVGFGTLSPAEGKYPDKTVVKIVATPETNWTASRYEGVDSICADTAYITMTEHTKVTAYFSKIISGDTLFIQENEKGFCNVDGSIDNDNSGFTGDGYANTENAVDSSITWAVQIPEKGFYNLIFSYANATSGDRAGSLNIDDSLYYEKVSLPGTGDWIKWDTTHDYTVLFEAGSHYIKLSATTQKGLSNIDYIAIIGQNPERINCDSVGIAPDTNTTTGLEKNYLSKIKIYPVPAKQGRFTIDLSQLEEGNFQVSIFNTMGQIVYSEKHFAREIIEVNNLKEGVYYVKISGKKYNDNISILIE
jgi:hypothetical protein